MIMFRSPFILTFTMKNEYVTLYSVKSDEHEQYSTELRQNVIIILFADSISSII